MPPRNKLPWLRNCCSGQALRGITRNGNDYRTTAAASHAVAVHKTNSMRFAFAVSAGGAASAANGSPLFNASATNGNHTTKQTRLAISSPAMHAEPPSTGHVTAAARACGRPGNHVPAVLGPRHYDGLRREHTHGQFLSAGARFS